MGGGGKERVHSVSLLRLKCTANDVLASGGASRVTLMGLSQIGNTWILDILLDFQRDLQATCRVPDSVRMQEGVLESPKN